VLVRLLITMLPWRYGYSYALHTRQTCTRRDIFIYRQEKVGVCSGWMGCGVCVMEVCCGLTYEEISSYM
jgi:hypothetical protein